MTFQIGDRVVCPEHPYLGEMEIVKVYEISKVEFIAKGEYRCFVQGTENIFAFAKPRQLTQLSLF